MRRVLAQRRRESRGATAVVMALVTCFVLLPLSALAVDIGQQRVVRSDMQTAADTVALDMAQKLRDGSTPTDADAQADFRATALGNTPGVKLYLGYIDHDGTWSSDQGLGCGSGSHYNSYFEDPVVAGKSANAVMVAATGSVRFSMSAGSGGACRSAIATFSNQTACFTADSYAAQLNSGNSLVLNPILSLLGTSVDTTVLSSSGIATANVNVLDFLDVLKTNVGVGSVDELLNTNVSALQVLTAEAQVLTRAGSTAGGAINGQYIPNLGHLPQNLTFPLKSLIGLSQGSGTAATANVNAFDLAMAALNLADGSHALTLAVSPATSVADLHATATVIQKPQIQCGPVGTQATSSQVNLAASGSIDGVDLVSELVDAVGSTLSLVSCATSLVTGHCQTLGATVDPFSVTASLANASGTLTGITCSGSTATGLTLQESSSLAAVNITIPITISYTDKNIYTGATTTRTTTLTVTAATKPTQGSAVTGTFSLPTDYNQAKAGPSGNIGLGSSDTLDVTMAVTSDSSGLIGGLLGSLASVTDAVTGVVGALQSTVLKPLLSTLTSALHTLIGLDLAGSTFTAYPTASCGGPQLVG